VTSPASSTWRSAGAILFCSSALLFLLYWPTVVSLVAMWRTSTYSYGAVIIPCAAYLVWSRRKRLAELHPAPEFWALPVLAALGFGWLLGQLTATDALQQFCLVTMLIVLIWSQVGTGAAKALLMPLAFLLFAIPMGDGLIPALQDFTAQFAVKLLDFSRIPVLLEGRYISVPQGRWEVAEACSGVRYLYASLVVGFLFAGLAYRSWVRRVSFLLASAVVPILANGVRVYGIILLGYLGGSRVAVGVDHVLAGFLFFSIVTAVLLALGLRWREKPKLDSAEVAVHPPGASAPVSQGPASSYGLSSLPRSGMSAVLAIAILGVPPISAHLIWNQLAGSAAGELKPPGVSPPWKPVDWDSTDWRPFYLKPSSEIIQNYESGDHAVKLYVAHYAPNQRGTKLGSSSNRLFDKPEWWRAREGNIALEAAGHTFRAHVTFIRSAERSLMIWSWYWVDGTYTESDYAAKLLLAKARLFGSRAGSAAIALATDAGTPGPQTETVLKDFLSHASLEASLRAAQAKPH